MNHVQYPGPPMYVLTLSGGTEIVLTQWQWDWLDSETQQQLETQGRVQKINTPLVNEYQKP